MYNYFMRPCTKNFNMDETLRKHERWLKAEEMAESDVQCYYDSYMGKRDMSFPIGALFTLVGERYARGRGRVFDATR